MAVNRKHVWMWIVYVRSMFGHLKDRRGKAEWKFFPLTDVHGDAIAFGSKESAASTLYEQKRMRGARNAYLQKVGPWS